MARVFIAVLVGLALASSADAHKLIQPGPRDKIANGTYSAAPASTWNRLDQKEGKYQEIWTIDGDQLNQIMFFGGVPDGEPLLRERNKKTDPLPKVAVNMLLTDIPVLLERTYRTYYATTAMSVGLQEPAVLAGMDGIRFEYTYTALDDEVERKGEAFAALENGRLYLVAYEAPSLYYFARDRAKFLEIVRSIELR